MFLQIFIFQWFHMLRDEWVSHRSVCDCDSVTVSATWQQLHHDTMTGVIMTWWHDDMWPRLRALFTPAPTLTPHPQLSSRVLCKGSQLWYRTCTGRSDSINHLKHIELVLCRLFSLSVDRKLVVLDISPVAWRPYPGLSPISSTLPSVRGGCQMKHQFIPRWLSWTYLTSLTAAIINVDNHKIYHDKCPPDGNKNMINNTPSLRHCLL